MLLARQSQRGKAPRGEDRIAREAEIPSTLVVLKLGSRRNGPQGDFF